jgi:hypothetical protein
VFGKNDKLLFLLSFPLLAILVLSLLIANSSQIPFSQSKLFPRQSSIIEISSIQNKNDASSSASSFVYSPPTLQVNLSTPFNKLCYGHNVYEVLNMSTEIVETKLINNRAQKPLPNSNCYGAQLNELLKYPTGAEREQLQKNLLQEKSKPYNLTRLTEYFDSHLVSLLYSTPELKQRSHSQQVQELFKNFPSVQTGVGGCNPSLWDYIANPGPPRFMMLNPCVTVTGTVVGMSSPSDGDKNFAVVLDKPYENLVSKGNFNDKMKGGIWLEIGCQNVNKNNETIHQNDCPVSLPAAPKLNSTFATGDHIKVTGAYIMDVREYGHTEIHPVSSISKLPTNATHASSAKISSKNKEIITADD